MYERKSSLAPQLGSESRASLCCRAHALRHASSPMMAAEALVYGAGPFGSHAVAPSIECT